MFIIFGVSKQIDMKVQDLKKLLDGMDGELPVVFKVDGFNFRSVEVGNESVIRQALILE